MTSAINSSVINTNFPIAGQDNDSQGFRNNFSEIASNFTSAASEISDLQAKSVLSASLGTSPVPVVNNLLGSTLSNGLYQQLSGTLYKSAGVSGAKNIDLTVGAVQEFTLSGDVTMTFANWPAYSGTSVYSNAIVMFNTTAGVTYYPTFASSGGNITYDSAFPTSTISGVLAPSITVGGESIASITVSQAGTGFTSPVTIGFTGGTPDTSTVRITPTATASYKVVSATVVSGGTGFAVGDQVVMVADSHVILNVATITGGGSTGPIGTLTVLSSNNQVKTGPYSGTFNLVAITGSGTGATASISSGISAITVTNPGLGYTPGTTAPTVVINGGGGTGAIATATLTSNNSSKMQVVEAWTVNGGLNVYLRYLGAY